MVVCLQRGADLHMAHLMPLPLTVSCFSKVHRLALRFWYRLTRVVPDDGPLNGRVCVSYADRCSCGDGRVRREQSLLLRERGVREDSEQLLLPVQRRLRRRRLQQLRQTKTTTR